MQQAKVYMYSYNSWQWKKIDEVCGFVCKKLEICDIFAKEFIQHRYYGSIFTSLFLNSQFLKDNWKGLQRYIFPE